MQEKRKCVDILEKPIAARQRIKALPEIARNKPHLKKPIRAALQAADTETVQKNMRPLIEKDIAQVLEELQEIGE